ncbi:MAG: hypothetical protein ABL894_01930 [Hyphomicrobium sp.]
MIVCSCAVITDHDIELAVLDIMSVANSPLPTPGVVFRHLQKKMNCCGCAPLAVETIYEKMDALAAKGLICPCACATAQDKLSRMVKKPAERALAGED